MAKTCQEEVKECETDENIPEQDYPGPTIPKEGLA
jgi:hypothetical protein